MSSDIPITPRSEITIEVVEDDNDLRNTLAMVLTRRGYQVRPHPSAISYLESEKLPGLCLMLLDIRMPSMTGLELHAELQRRGDRIPVIFMSGENLPHQAESALGSTAVAFLSKPFRTQELLAAIELAVQSLPN